MTATFQCILTPPANVRIEWWFTPHGSQRRVLVADQHGATVANYTIVQGHTGSLTLVIQNVRYPNNWGTYTCSAQTSSMTREESAILTVLCKFTLCATREDHVSYFAQLYRGLW